MGRNYARGPQVRVRRHWSTGHGYSSASRWRNATSAALVSKGWTSPRRNGLTRNGRRQRRLGSVWRVSGRFQRFKPPNPEGKPSRFCLFPRGFHRRISTIPPGMGEFTHLACHRFKALNPSSPSRTSSGCHARRNWRADTDDLSNTFRCHLRRITRRMHVPISG